MATTKSSTKPIILVDGSSYLYRAYHAMAKAGLSNSRGEPTGAIYGMTNMLRKLLADYEPEYIAVVFDAKGKTFRHELYAEYKANRPAMPDDLRGQIQPVHDIVRAMGLPLIMVEGVEADDVIGTLARQATENKKECLISTGDKDMAQLVTDHVGLVNTMTDTNSDHNFITEKYGVRPDQFIDYLALVGDSSDNIPGVPKVGPKTASKWLQEYGDINTLLKNADNIKGKIGENLRAAIDQIPLSRELATIKTDVELPLSLDELKRQSVDHEKLRQLYLNFEFSSWLSELSAEGKTDISSKETTYETILDQKRLDDWLKRLNKAELIALDMETTSLDIISAEIVGLSFTDRGHVGAYVPLAHDYPGAPKQLDRQKVLQQLKPLIEDASVRKVGQNLKYDMSVLANYDIELNGIAFDTMLESYVLDSTATRHDMDSLALKYLDTRTTKFEEVAGKGKNQLIFNEVGLEQAGPYAAEDADISFRLHETLWPKIEAIPDLKRVFLELELPLISVLSRVERTGVKIDSKMLRQQSKELSHRLLEVEQEAHKVAGQVFNLASPKQIQEILFEKQGLPILRKTPKGQPSTSEEVLQELTLDYDLPELILEYRSLSKLKSTYTDKLPEMVNEKTGRVHTSYHQAVTATGRLSSSDPNLQNIPVRTAEGRRIRQAFVAEKGSLILSADYSQIELRIMAHLSADPGLVNAFLEGKDVHRSTAAEVFSCLPEEVTDEQRRHAKAINFGLIYGMSAFGLSRQLKIDRAEAQKYIDLYFERYPGVQEYMNATRKLAHDQGYVETVFGRRLYLPEINASNHNRRQYAERTAINAPMQGTAADLIKLAMLSVDAWIRQTKIPVKMIMQVHDELVFEVTESRLDEARAYISQCMTGVADLSVPLVVDVGVGLNWNEAH